MQILVSYCFVEVGEGHINFTKTRHRVFGVDELGLGLERTNAIPSLRHLEVCHGCVQGDQTADAEIQMRLINIVTPWRCTIHIRIY